MTAQDDLDEIDVLEKAATPAPWQACVNASNHMTADISADNSDDTYAMTVRLYAPGAIDPDPWCDWRKGNLDLVIAARNLLPHLIAEVGAARLLYGAVKHGYVDDSGEVLCCACDTNIAQLTVNHHRDCTLAAYAALREAQAQGNT